MTRDQHIAIRTLLLVAALALVSPAAAHGQGERWYKGNTHTHSLWSDGDDFPEMVVDWYVRNGYDFLVLTEHNRINEGEMWRDIDHVISYSRAADALNKYRARFPGDWVETRVRGGKEQVRLKTLDELRQVLEVDAKFLLIQGEEITDSFQTHAIHFNALNLIERIGPKGGASVRDTMRNIMRAVREQQDRFGQPILVHLNHCNHHYSITPEDLAHVTEIDFFEVWSGHVSIAHEGDGFRPGDEAIWDIANTIRLGELGKRPVYGVAVDDAHTYHGRTESMPGRGWIMVRAQSLTVDEIFSAMRRGDFYGSSGVTLRDVRYDPRAGTLTVEIEPVEGETYLTQFIGTKIDYDRSTQPLLDRDGNRLDGRKMYSSDVGQVFATVEGVNARYQLTGEELYIRATVISSAAPDRPVIRDNVPLYKDQRKKAWTQPVGWEGHLQE